MNSAIILAGGSGTRFKSKTPKQFAKLNDKMIVEYSILQFYNNNNIDEIILVCSDYWGAKIQKKYPKIKYTNGGCTRLESSYLGLLKCHNKCINVLIHDSARPFISQTVINNSLTHLNKFDAVIPTINCDDSLINEETLQYLQREKIKLIQTPQAFNYKKILKSYTELANKSLFNEDIFKDDLSVLLEYDNDIKTKLFDGDKANFKITNKDDLTKAIFFETQC